MSSRPHLGITQNTIIASITLITITKTLTSSFQMHFAPYSSWQKQCAAERTKRWEKKTKGENITSIVKL